MTPTTIQTIAAIIQAAGSILFLCTVIRDHKERKQEQLSAARQKEQARRDTIINQLTNCWCSSRDGITPEELSGIFSPRQIEFFNKKLSEMGEKWSYPFDRY